MKRTPKYRAKPCTVGTEKYRSQRERDRHQALLLLEKAGQISGLQREVPFELAPGVRLKDEKRKRPPIRYVADFVYLDAACRRVVEDSKGVRTAVYRLKKHLMAVVHGIHLQES